MLSVLLSRFQKGFENADNTFMDKVTHLRHVILTNLNQNQQNNLKLLLLN